MEGINWIHKKQETVTPSFLSDLGSERLRQEIAEVVWGNVETDIKVPMKFHDERWNRPGGNPIKL